MKKKRSTKVVKWKYQTMYAMLLMRVDGFSRERVEEITSRSFLLWRIKVLMGKPISIFNSRSFVIFL